MHFEPGHIYHVYNRGNNRIRIFFNQENYLYLLRKVLKEWRRYCDIFCYCLMPNHFHFMLQPNEEGCHTVLQKNQPTHLQLLSRTIGKTLSSYTQAINIQNNTIGNLFQKKTKAKWLTDPGLDVKDQERGDYPKNCFWYIHYNPKKARIVKRLADWPYSSWPDYHGFRDGKICNRELAMQRIGITRSDLSIAKVFKIDEEIIKGIW